MKYTIRNCWALVCLVPTLLFTHPGFAYSPPTCTPAIVLSAAITNAFCNGSSGGAINLTVTNGVAPFTYNWSSSQTTKNISALAAGVYSVTVTDFTGCTQTASYTVIQSSPQPTASSPITYCQFSTASPLTATALSGYALRWYTVPSGGTASGIAPTPSTSSSGTTSYYVSQDTIDITLAIIGWKANGSATTDTFQFVALKPIRAGTVIYFTDNGWNSATGRFRGIGSTAATSNPAGSEQLCRFNVSTTISAGTIIKSYVNTASYSWTISGAIPGVGNGSNTDFGPLVLSATGDQISAFINDSSNSPLFYTASMRQLFTFDNTNGFEAGAISGNNQSGIPPGLVLGTTANTFPFSSPTAYTYVNLINDNAFRTPSAWFSYIAVSANYTTATGTAGTLPPFLPGTLNVTSTGSSSCESPRTQIVVNINPTPVPVISSVPGAVVCGTSLTLHATPGFLTYNWSNGFTSVSTDSVLHSTTTGFWTYTVTASYPGGCMGTASVSTSLFPVPTPVITSTQNNFCAGGSTTLDGGAGFATYLWSPGNQTSQSVIATPPSTTTYTVTVSNAGSCTGTSSFAVIVNPTPPAPVATNRTRCGPGIPISSVLGTGGTFKWYLVPSGGSPIVGEMGSTLTTYSISTTTTFYVSEIYSKGPCEGPRVAVTETVIQLDPVTANAVPSSSCPGSQIALHAVQSGSNNVYTFSWTAAPLSGSGITSSLPGQNVFVFPTTPNTYIYTVTATEGACSKTASTSVVISPAPVIYSVDANPDTIFTGGSSTLTALAESFVNSTITIGTGVLQNSSNSFPTPYGQFFTGGRSQMLIPASELIAAGMTLGNISSLAFDVTDAGSSYMNFKISIGTTSLTALTDTFVNGLTQVFTAPTLAPVVGLNTHTFSTPYYWNGSSNIIVETTFLNCVSCPTTACSNFSTNDQVHQTSTAYVSTLEAHADNNCSIISATTGIQYFQRANIRFSGQFQSIGPSSASWLWTPGSLSGNVVSASPTTPTTYTVTATATNSCTTTATVPVTVLSSMPKPIISVSTSTLCISGTSTLAITNIITGVGYQWQSSSTGISGSWANIPSATGTTYTTNNLTATTFFRAFASSGAFQDTSATITITVLTPSISTLTGASTCGPNTAILTASGNGTFDWFAFSTNGTALATNTNTFSATVTETTTFWVQAHSGTCLDPTGRHPVTYTITPYPAITVVGNPMTICQGESTVISVSSPNDPHYKYTWSSIPAGYTNNGTGPFTVSPNVTTEYHVTALDTTTGVNTGCRSLGFVKITVNITPTVSSSISTNSVCTGEIVNLFSNYTTPMDTMAESFEGTPINLFSLNGTNASVTQTSTYFTNGTKSVLLAPHANGVDESYGLTRNISLASISSPVLSFDHICATEAGYDFGFVEYSYDGGASWFPFQTSDYTGSGMIVNGGVSFDKSSYPSWDAQFTSTASTPGAGPGSTLWKHETIDLAAYDTCSQFRFRFRIVTDPTDEYYGWLLDNVKITGSGPAAPGILWSSNPTGFFSEVQNPDNIVPSTDVGYGNISFIVTVTAFNGCWKSSNVMVESRFGVAQPVVTPENSVVLCYDGFTPLTVPVVADTTGSGPGHTISWNDKAQSTTLGIQLTADSTNHTTAYSYGVYWITFTVTNNLGCHAGDSIQFIVDAPPQPIVSADDTLFCEGESTILHVSPKAFSYQWILNDTISLGTDSFLVAYDEGVYTVKVQSAGSCETTSEAITLHFDPTCVTKIIAKAFLQGYYLGGGQMNPVLFNQNVMDASFTQCDTITIELHEEFDPTIIADQSKTILNTDGVADTARFTLATPGGLYWIVLKHRNSVETWSAAPILLVATNSYDFTQASTMVYGDNMAELSPGIWGLYSADLDQDGYILNTDFSSYDLDNYNQVGPDYVNTDLDGDGYVLNIDFSLFDVNNYNQIGKVVPY